jgi:hypothetical protein
VNGTINKKGDKIQSWYDITVLGMKGRFVSSVNKDNRINNLGGIIMAADG